MKESPREEDGQRGESVIEAPRWEEEAAGGTQKPQKEEEPQEGATPSDTCS